MERFPKLESLLGRLSIVVIATVSSTQLALADSNAPPGSQILPGVYQGSPVIAQQSGWPNTPPQWQSNPGNTSSMPAPPPQNPSYQPQLVLPSNDPNPYGASAPGQAPMQGYTQFQQQQQIQPGQLQGYPVSQQAPGQLPPQGYGAPQGYPQQQQQQQQPQYAPQQNSNTQYGQAQQSAAPASPPGWQADYPNPNDLNNSTASQVPMDTAQPQKQGLGSKLGKALGGVAKMAGPMAGMGMAGMAAASMGNMMMNPYGMGGMGMGGYGMGGMGMGGYGMGGMGMGGYGMPMGMGMGGMGMGGMGMGQNMMMNSVLNQGLRMLQR
ncbi:MAG TPA: hypothetical protein V6C89_18990 [Drouetiella sp.]|jgi:hypothetical protein